MGPGQHSIPICCQFFSGSAYLLAYISNFNLKRQEVQQQHMKFIKKA
jgi:hypothetical protein